MNKMTITQIDPNLAVATGIQEERLSWLDAANPVFDSYGFCEEDGPFRRVPAAVAETVSPSIVNLADHTSGGRLRFTTNSPYVAIQAKIPVAFRFSHMPLTGTAGFDLYEDGPSGSRWVHTFLPPEDMKDGYESIVYFPDRRSRSFTLNFPLYSSVSRLTIGLEEGSSIEPGRPYRLSLPVFYYGSSITQGGCASRPGNSYPNLISERWNLGQRNFGFSGSCRGEATMIDYMASLDFSAFVMDYDYNAPDPMFLKQTHEPAFRKIRASHPDKPILVVSRPNFKAASEEDRMRREIVYETVRHARDAGDMNVRFIDGESLLGSEFRDACTVDGVHPTDAGFVRMASVIGNALAEQLFLAPDCL